MGQARWAGRVPDLPWLSRSWLTQYLTEGPPRSVQIEDDYWDRPQVAVWHAKTRKILRSVWADHTKLLAAACRAEQTLCHLDVWPANLLDADGRSVLVDWSFFGQGAVGEDVSNLIIDSFTDGLMDPGLLPELAEHVTDAYLDGLRDGGWSGSADRVRAAVAACGAAKYSWLGPAILGRAVSGDLGKSSYNKDNDVEAAVARVSGLLTLVGEWAETGVS